MRERRGQDSFWAFLQLATVYHLVFTSLVMAVTCECAFLIGCDHVFSPVVTPFVPLGQTLRTVGDAHPHGGVNMSKHSNEELRPRNGHTLVVAIVCRISGCAKQKELSNEDQEDNAKEKIAELYDGKVEFRIISTKAKGEALDRPELEEIEAAYKSGRYDVFVYDDLSRLIRGGEAARLLGWRRSRHAIDLHSGRHRHCRGDLGGRFPQRMQRERGPQ